VTACARLALAALLPGAATGVASAQWCEVEFKIVAERAPLVVLAEYRQPSKKDDPVIAIVETFKGHCDHDVLNLAPITLDSFTPMDGDLFVVALRDNRAVIRIVRGMGACTANSILPIRKGKLRSKHRVLYDGFSGTMTLDELRSELTVR
jgi:hypothetical protein